MSLEPQVLIGWFQIFISKMLVSPTILNCFFGVPGLIFLNDFNTYILMTQTCYLPKRRNAETRNEFRKVRRSRNARKDFKVLTTRIIAAFSVPIIGPRTTKSTWKWIKAGGDWVFPKNRGIFPQNGWFIMENPIKMDALGGKPTNFRKHPYWYLVDTLPETNSKSTWKWMVGILGPYGLFSGVMLVLVSVRISTWTFSKGATWFH